MRANGKSGLHGASKRRRWGKGHLAVDVEEKDIVGVEVITESGGDNEIFEGVIDAVLIKLMLMVLAKPMWRRVNIMQGLLCFPELMRLNGGEVIGGMVCLMKFKKRAWQLGKTSLAAICVVYLRMRLPKN